MSKVLSVGVFILMALTLSGFVVAQEPSQNDAQEQNCEMPFYTSQEVSRKAKITHLPSPEITEEFRARQQRGRGILTAILCKTGKVTNIEIIEGLPYGMNERLIDAVRGVTFIPAEKDGQAVSQRQRFEFHISMF